VGPSAAAPGAGLVVTDLAEIADPAWRSMVERAHESGALVVARLALGTSALEAVPAGVERAAAAGVDVILLDPGADAAVIEALPAAIAAARAAWRPGGWIAAVIHDRPAMRAAVIGHAAQVVRAGADLLWVTAPSEHQLHATLTYGARLPAAPLADRLRNELGVATAIECGEARRQDLDAAIAAGRADVVVVDKLPEGVRGAP
jgi:hypothetical protein